MKLENLFESKEKNLLGLTVNGSIFNSQIINKETPNSQWEGDFYANFFNEELTSLRYAPEHITGSFKCNCSELDSLKYGPKWVGGNFECSSNKVTSLRYAPQHVGADFKCGGCELISLQHGPQQVNGDFDCSVNKLTSLQYAPRHVAARFNCSDNKLTSLQYAPQHVGSDFNCSDNELTSLEGAPEYIGRNFKCYRTKLVSLKDIHNIIHEIHGTADFSNTPIKSHVLGLLKIKGLTSVTLNHKKVQKIINDHLRKQYNDILDCQSELIDAGYLEFAKL